MILEREFINEVRKNLHKSNGKYLVPFETVLFVKNYRMWVQYNFSKFFGDKCFQMSIDDLIKAYVKEFELMGIVWEWNTQNNEEYFKKDGKLISQFNKITGEIKEWHSDKEIYNKPLISMVGYDTNLLLNNYLYNGHYSQGRYEYVNEWSRNTIIVSESGELLQGIVELY